MPKKRIPKPVPKHLKWLPEFKYDGVNLCELSPEERRSAFRNWTKHNNAFVDRRRHWIDALKKEYQTGGSPLCVWGAYLAIREWAEPVPDWILEYFDRVAAGLYSDRNKPEDFALHLGFNLKDGGPGFFKTYADRRMRLYAVAWVHNELSEKPEVSIDKACEAAAAAVKELYGDENEFEPGTIKKWYYKEDG